jgi:hypothetical protein
VTFCLWWDAARPAWSIGVRSLPEGHDPDGSEGLLAIYDGEAETYASWASNYYEADVARDAVAAVCRHEPLTEALVRRLNPHAPLEAVLEESASWPYGDE